MISKDVRETHPVVALPVSGLEGPQDGVLGEGAGGVPQLLGEGDLGEGDPSAVRVGNPVVMWNHCVVWLSQLVPSLVPHPSARMVAAPTLPTLGHRATTWGTTVSSC